MNDPIVFSKEWFERHQGKLLWLLNHWLTRRWFRWVLRIRRHDIGYDKEIVELFPHAYTVFIRELGDGRCELATDFRTHPKYAKRLYYAFKPVWWMAHFWDWLIADRLYNQQLSFGFTTLTLYPSAGSVSPCDGMAGRITDATFSVIRSGAGNTTATNGATENCELIASATTNQFSTLRTLIFNFDTSTIGNSIIESAVFSLVGNAPTLNLGDTTIEISGITPAVTSIISSGDFALRQTVSFGSFTISNTTGNYDDLTFNATGLAYIKTSSITSLSLQLGWDINASFTGVWASLAATTASILMADTGGTLADPKFVVTYSVKSWITLSRPMRPGMFRPGVAR